MKALKLNGEIFIWINLYPADRFGGRMKYLPVITTANIVTIEVLGTLACFTFIQQNLNDVKNCLYALFPVLCTGSALYTWIVAFRRRDQIFNIIRRFQDICSESKFKQKRKQFFFFW